jgi:hypothetical protein
MIDLLNRIGFKQVAFGGGDGGGGGGGAYITPSEEGLLRSLGGTIILHRWPPQLLQDQPTAYQ